MLIDTVAKADSLAAALGPNRAALLRAHGAVVVGPTIQEALMIAIYMARTPLSRCRAAPRTGGADPFARGDGGDRPDDVERERHRTDVAGAPA
jgi:hypothetical protein